MSDEEFADRVCGNGEVWSCDDCVNNKINDYAFTQDCYERFHKWLQQEHEFNSSNSIKRVKVRVKLKRQSEGVSND